MFTTALHELPGLIAELRTRLEPGTGEETGRRPPGFAKHAPTNLGPLDAADDLFGSLVEHAGAIADMLGTKPPRTRAWGGHRGIPAHMDASTAQHQAAALARFIEHQHPLIQDRDFAGEIEADIIKRWQKASGRFPLTPSPERIDARCRNCGRLNLHQHPPETAGGDQTWKCHTCGLHLLERDVIERLAAREREKKHKRKKAA
jgi:hypothetical protein